MLLGVCYVLGYPALEVQDLAYRMSERCAEVATLRHHRVLWLLDLDDDVAVVVSADDEVGNEIGAELVLGYHLGGEGIENHWMLLQELLVVLLPKCFPDHIF